MNGKFFLFSTYAFLFGLTIVSAQKVNDAGLWSTFTLQKDISKKITVTLDQEFRLKENYSQLNLFYTNLGISYKLFKGLKIEPSYRYIDKFIRDGNFSYRHRFSTDLVYKNKIENVSYSFRIRYQRESKDVLTSSRKWLSEKYLRARFQLEYPVSSKINTFYSCEFRYQIDVPGNDAEFNNRWHRIRNVVGFDYKINSSHSISMYYLVQNEFDISPRENSYITGIQFTKKL